MSDYLKEGDVITIKGEHTVYADIPKHFRFDNCKGDFSLTHCEVSVEKWQYLSGKYVVYKTANEGGGTGHGPGDLYPDGHHVFCESVIDPSIKVDFYQSGCFTAMIHDIKPCGRAERTWTYSEEV